MSGIILELQKEALTSKGNVSDLLRKAWVVAKKLGITEMEKWITAEMEGYENDDDIPDYRYIEGRVKLFNNYTKVLTPIYFATEREKLLASKRLFATPALKIESAIKNHNDNTTELAIHYPAEIQNKLMKILDTDSIPMLIIPLPELEGILSSIKNCVLNWTLELEKKGIVGEWLTFSDKERKRASNIVYNVRYMTNSQIQSGASNLLQPSKAEGSVIGAVIHAIKKWTGLS